MSNFPCCCSPVGTGTNTGDEHTIENVGGGVESYVIGTGPNPFELRTFESSDSSVSIVQNAETIDLTVDASELVSLANVGGFAEVWVDTTGPNPFDLRTLQSSDSSVSITQNADNIDITVEAGAASMENIGTGLDVWDNPTSEPFELRRMEVIDDGSDLHGSGNLSFWTDGDTNKIDLPRGHVQNNNTISPFDFFETLIEHTFNDDSAGANVAGKDGEDWIVWWSLKICGNPGFGGIDYISTFQVDYGAGWTIVDSHTVRWEVGTVPSAPACRPWLLQNTNWSTFSGLKTRIRCRTSSFAVSGVFEDPSIHIQRFNK